MSQLTRVVVLIDDPPVGHAAAAEGLRMALGLKLAENEYTVVLVDEGVRIAAPVRPELAGTDKVARHLETIPEFGGEILVHRESAESRGVNPKYRKIDDAEFRALLENADAVIEF